MKDKDLEKRHHHIKRAVPVAILCFAALAVAGQFLPQSFWLEILKKTLSGIIAVSCGLLFDWFLHYSERIHQLTDKDKKWGWLRRLGYILSFAIIFSSAL